MVEEIYYRDRYLREKRKIKEYNRLGRRIWAGIWLQDGKRGDYKNICKIIQIEG